MPVRSYVHVRDTHCCGTVQTFALNFVDVWFKCNIRTYVLRTYSTTHSSNCSRCSVFIAEVHGKPAPPPHAHAHRLHIPVRNYLALVVRGYQSVCNGETRCIYARTNQLPGTLRHSTYAYRYVYVHTDVDDARVVQASKAVPMGVHSSIFTGLLEEYVPTVACWHTCAMQANKTFFLLADTPARGTEVYDIDNC